MEPRKAKTAILITVIVALLIILICLGLLFDVIPLAARENIDDLTAQEATVTEIPEEEPEETPAPVIPTPSASDLKGCSKDLYFPNSESFLAEYQSMIIHSSAGGSVALQYRPEAKERQADVIVLLDNNTPVTALAKENGYTLVLVKEGLAGWLLTYELDSY